MTRRSLAFLLAFQLLIFGGVPGCKKASAPTAAPSQPPTFYRNVAPILFARCVSCHHPDGAAPFSLLTYDDASSRSSQIVEVTASRYMPPWLPEVGHEEIRGNRRLSEGEIKLLTDWAAAGAPAGDHKDSPPAPKSQVGWQLGEPDLVVESPPFELPAEGPNRFRNFVLTIGDDLNRWVRAVEIRPLVPQITHHARLGIDSNNESVRRDAADADVGYEGMAWGADPDGQLITWTPGVTADAGTAGAAWHLTSDEKLVLHTHLQPSGKPETARFRLGFYFADAPPTLNPLMLRIGSRDIDIRPGESRHQVESSYELPVDVDVHFALPHAHSLCRDVIVQSQLPNGSLKTLLAIRRFDENWHDTYRFAKPVRLPRGTRLVTTFTYDNTAANIRNPNNPPKRVVYGSNADDEMSDVYLQVTPVDPAQRSVLAEHHDAAELASKIVGYSKSLELHPDDQWSIEALASCYVAQRQPGKAVQLLEAKPDLLRSSIQANVILGMAHLAQPDVVAAEKRLRGALAMDGEDAVAWLGLGQALVGKREPQLAEKALRRAIQLAPRLMVARLDLADLLAADERLDEAVKVCEEAIEVAPADHKPHLKLANFLAAQKKYDESLKHFAAARALAPYVYEPKASLAIACYQLGDETTADRLLSEALAKDSHDPVPHCFLGQIARRNEQWQKAKMHFERASELLTSSSWPASHRRQFLTLVYSEQLQLADQLQDQELAGKVLTAWLKIDPTNDGLQRLLRQIQVGNQN